MLDGYKSPGGSHINMDALMMVGFNAMQPNITAQSQFYMAKQQQQFLEEQNAIVRQSTAKLLMAQEELTNEAIKAKEELVARTGSGGTDARKKGLLDEVAALSEELLVERKKSLELLRELNREKDLSC
jgi:hypothetical protein